MRLRSLDGLRGVAAFVVLVSHVIVLENALMAYYYTRAAEPSAVLEWVITFTPLHVLWAGSEAVYLFFVLSGIVLTLPMLRVGQSWLAYYPRRIVRLYVPAIASVLFAGLLYLLFPRNPLPEGAGDWMAALPLEYTPPAMLADATLLIGDFYGNPPLWSLRIEVLFSLLLPAYVFSATWLRRYGWAKAIVLVAALAVTSSLGFILTFQLLMFAVGALMAVHWDDLSRLAARIEPRPWIWVAIVVVAILAICIRWELRGFGVPDPVAVRFEWIVVVGVTLLIFATALAPRMVRAFTTAPVAWLGRVSFSLYLTHVPILQATRLVALDLPPLLVGVIGAVIALGFAELFYRVVESPAHRLSQRIGRSITAALARRAERRAADPAPTAAE